MNTLSVSFEERFVTDLSQDSFPR